MSLRTGLPRILLFLAIGLRLLILILLLTLARRRLALQLPAHDLAVGLRIGHVRRLSQGAVVGIDGLLVLANHPTLIDVVFLMSLLPGADCVVKSALARNPFTRGPVRAAGYVCNDDGVALVDDCIEAVRRGGNLLIFPEGTRTRRGEPLKLQRGAANIAVRGCLDVTPVRLSCTPMTLGKGEKWYRVPVRRFHFVVDVQPDLEVSSFIGAGQGEAVAARRLTDYLTHFLAAGEPACQHSSWKSSN